MSRGKRYTAEQIIKILREVEIYTGQGETVAQGSLLNRELPHRHATK